MYIIGMTGGISSGKSAVTETLCRRIEAVSLDIDTVTHWQSEPGGVLFEIYVRHFGDWILTDDGNLNRRQIAEIIFSNPDEREWINSVAHPILLNHARDFLVECQEVGVRLAIVEVPLLFEAGWEHLFDEIWAVYTKRQLQIRRLMSRDKLSKQQALARINAQMPKEEICARADVVIRNVGKRFEILQQIQVALRGRTF